MATAPASAAEASASELSHDELLQLVRNTSFERVDADGSRTISREELHQVLSGSLQRPLTESELARAWETLDEDNNGRVDLNEWRRAGGCIEAETLAGAARGLFQTVLRILPRTPAMRFFKPKDQRFRAATEPESTLLSRAKGKLGLMVVSAGASFVLFKSHNAATRHEALAETASSDFVGGAIGGVLHACVVQPFAQPSAPWWQVQARLSGLRVLALKDALGFGTFFGVHSAAQRALNARVACASEGSALGSASHLRAVGASVAAGGAAGACYHAVSHPFDRALALAYPATDPARVAEAVVRAGPRALYSGLLRTAAPGVCMGALTFGLYDLALRYADQRPGAGQDGRS